MTYSWPVRDSSLRSLCLSPAQVGKQEVRKALAQPHLSTLLLETCSRKRIRAVGLGLGLLSLVVIDADIHVQIEHKVDLQYPS